MRKSHFKALAARRSVTSEPAPVADSSRETADCDVRISIANSRCASPRLLRASRNCRPRLWFTSIAVAHVLALDHRHPARHRIAERT